MELKLVTEQPKASIWELLIVPYGIETVVTDEILNQFSRTFNRTLWN